MIMTSSTAKATDAVAVNAAETKGGPKNDEKKYLLFDGNDQLLFNSLSVIQMSRPRNERMKKWKNS